MKIMKSINKILMFTLFFLSIFALIGCASNPEVIGTRQWEGHYYSVEEFKLGTDELKLEKNESIWVLSNGTMKRLLKNTGK